MTPISAAKLFCRFDDDLFINEVSGSAMTSVGTNLIVDVDRGSALQLDRVSYLSNPTFALSTTLDRTGLRSRASFRSKERLFFQRSSSAACKRRSNRSSPVVVSLRSLRPTDAIESSFAAFVRCASLNDGLDRDQITQFRGTPR